MMHLKPNLKHQIQGQAQAVSPARQIWRQLPAGFGTLLILLGIDGSNGFPQISRLMPYQEPIEVMFGKEIELSLLLEQTKRPPPIPIVFRLGNDIEVTALVPMPS